MSGYGKPNPRCATCGDERGGTWGHDTGECRYVPGMTDGELAATMSFNRAVAYWGHVVDAYLARELSKTPEERLAERRAVLAAGGIEEIHLDEALRFASLHGVLNAIRVFGPNAHRPKEQS